VEQVSNLLKNPLRMALRK